MSQTNASTTTPEKATFYDSHRPKIESGTYRATFVQQIIVNSNPEKKPEQHLDFHVAGPRFNLPTSCVYAVDPPADARGNYMADLPKLVLKRSTLPWERSPKGEIPAENSASWLFLLLVDESETDHVKEYNGVELSGDAASATLMQGSDSIGTIDNMGGDLEFHQHKFQALLIDKSLVNKVIPESLTELQYLSYAMIKEGEEEHGVILCNRLPRPGSNSTVYLISVENNYNTEGSYEGIPFKSKESETTQNFYPYYYKWSFRSTMDYMVNEKIMSQLTGTSSNKGISFADLNPVYDTLFTSFEEFSENATVKTLSKEALPLVKKAAQLPGVTFHGLMSNLTHGFKAFTMAENGTSNITSIGAINVSFKAIEEKESKLDATSKHAFYHGPLVSAPIHISAATGFPMKLEKSDHSHSIPWTMQLKGTDVFFSGTQDDASYGAALELGRLTALNNVAFAESFISWKKQAAVALYQKGATEPHLSFYPNATYQAEIPEHICQQFEDWKQLKGVPYQYLIPDPDMLPLESLRYFYLDTHWINAFLYGAFSIGHTIQPDLLKPILNDLLMESSPNYQGFLLNSFAVSGYPDFEVIAYKTTDSSKPLSDTDLHISRTSLTKNIVIQAYKQPFKRLDFQLPHHKVHSGFLYEDDKYEKEGHDISNMTIADQTITNVSQLANDLGAKDNVSAFAAAMLEGIPYVQFTIGNGSD